MPSMPQQDRTPAAITSLLYSIRCPKCKSGVGRKCVEENADGLIFAKQVHVERVDDLPKPVIKPNNTRSNRMPQQNFSDKIGTSPSPSINSVIQNSVNVQQPVAVPAVVNSGQFNKQDVKVPR